MATLSAVRTALAAAVATTGISTLATIPDSIMPPVAIVGVPQNVPFVKYAETFDGALCYYLLVRLYVSRWDAPTAQSALDAYVAPTGASSVYAAIEADPSLGRVVDSAAVIDARGYGVYMVGEVQYIGAEWLVEIYAR